MSKTERLAALRKEEAELQSIVDAPRRLRRIRTAIALEEARREREARIAAYEQADPSWRARVAAAEAELRAAEAEHERIRREAVAHASTIVEAGSDLGYGVALRERVVPMAAIWVDQTPELAAAERRASAARIRLAQLRAEPLRAALA